MEQCPDAAFFDFSCQLEEYCLNREPMFWHNSHFYHDIFMVIASSVQTCILLAQFQLLSWVLILSYVHNVTHTFRKSNLALDL